MAAGIIYQTVTTTSGETVELAFYGDEPVTPTTWIPARLNVNTAGAPAAYGSGSNGTSVPRVALATDSPGVTAPGQTTMTASLPTAIASDQTWGVGAVGFTKLEDVASADGDKGIPAMAVRRLTPLNSSGADGDWEFLQVSAGQLWANTNKWQPGTSGFVASAFSLMTTELNSLANGNTAVGSVGGTSGVFTQTNTVNSRLAEIWLTVGGNFGATPAVGGTITGWFLKSTDGGTTFEDTNANTALARAPDFYLNLVAAAYSANDVVFVAGGPISLPTCAWKPYILNNAGASASLAASGNILTLAPVA